jgi:glycine cleavage system aminomethyltransferase T
MNSVAMWDVAAQRQVEISVPDAAQFIQYLTTRDISKTKVVWESHDSWTNLSALDSD